MKAAAAPRGVISAEHRELNHLFPKDNHPLVAGIIAGLLLSLLPYGFVSLKAYQSVGANTMPRSSATVRLTGRLLVDSTTTFICTIPLVDSQPIQYRLAEENVRIIGFSFFHGSKLKLCSMPGR